MQLLRRLILFLFCSTCATAATDSSQSAQCIACQILVTTLHAEVESRVANPASGRYSLDEAVATVLSERFACFSEVARGAWEGLAGRFGHEVEKLLSLCKHYLAAIEEELEEALQARSSVHDARVRICLASHDGKIPCSSVWTHKEAPVPRVALQAEAIKNQRISEAFLAANAKREGVRILESGLQYKVLRSGKGDIHPTKDDHVRVHYKATLTDCEPQPGPVACVGGTEFDSTYTKGDPYIFSAAIARSFWETVLPLMVSGDIWEVYVPHALAYGSLDDSARLPEKVGPGSALIFKVEFVGFKSDFPDPEFEGLGEL